MEKQLLKKYLPNEIDELSRSQRPPEATHTIKIILEKQNLIIGVLENMTLLISKERIKKQKIIS